MGSRGYVRNHTGNGKGKTIAAFGLAVRALCAGKNVYVGPLVKSMEYNETKIERLFNGSNPTFGRIRIEQLGRGCFIEKAREPADAETARQGWARCAALLHSGEYDVVILDELTIALHFGLLPASLVLNDLHSRCPSVEVIVTGRYAPVELLDAADLVTEMGEVKHYYTQSVLSRNGIDRKLGEGMPPPPFIFWAYMTLSFFLKSVSSVSCSFQNLKVISTNKSLPSFLYSRWFVVRSFRLPKCWM